ncbi:MAG: hypothetical protein QOI37_513 [Chloroflexota bacterium]|jgi:hypothetical protein|nr:hypothetical protein [Chloroflexota bacterium]
MASQAQRGSRGPGRSSRAGSSSSPVVAASEAGPGITATTKPRRRNRTDRSSALPPATRPAYRLLLMQGMTPTEAANLTAFMCGLPTTDLRWSLKQVNQLLFLRTMRQAGRFGGSDGDRTRPH